MRDGILWGRGARNAVTEVATDLPTSPASALSNRNGTVAESSRCRGHRRAGGSAACCAALLGGVVAGVAAALGGSAQGFFATKGTRFGHPTWGQAVCHGGNRFLRVCSSASTGGSFPRAAGLARQAGFACKTGEGKRLEKLLGHPRLEEFDSIFAAAVAKLPEDADEREAFESLRADFLYLAVVRRHAAVCLPETPCVEGPPGKTWAISGALAEMEGFHKVAGDRVFNVPMTTLSPAEQDVMRRAIVTEYMEAIPLLDAYLNREVGMTKGQAPSPEAPFATFLERCKLNTALAVYKVGGSGGLGAANFTQLSPESMGSPVELGDGAEEWVTFMDMILANTRLYASDDFLGHMYFGLSLRRLARRFRLMKSVGMLPELSEALQARLALERSMTDEFDHEALLTKAQFENFVTHQVQVGSDGEALDQVLDMGPVTLAAMRRLLSATFGESLREEFDDPMERVKRLLEGMDMRRSSVVERMEVFTSLLLEAGAAGEVRMLSAGVQAKERLAWSAIVFGALLEEVEDEQFETVNP